MGSNMDIRQSPAGEAAGVNRAAFTKQHGAEPLESPDPPADVAGRHYRYDMDRTGGAKGVSIFGGWRAIKGGPTSAGRRVSEASPRPGVP